MAHSTRTTNRLHFSDLDPKRFEDFCLNLVFPLNRWDDVRHYGRKGADGGVDIFACETLVNGTSRRWFIQCKRQSSATKPQLLRVIEEALARPGKVPDVLLLIVACDVRRDAHEAFMSFAAEKGISQAFLWSQSILEARLYNQRPDLLFTYFGISNVSATHEREAAIRRNVALKKRMRADLLLGGYPDPHIIQYKPWLKFHDNEVIVHSIDDTSYPEFDDAAVGISPWFKMEVWDFYHGGLEVILAISTGIIDEEGNWKRLDLNESFDPEIYKEIDIWVTGLIPFRNIVEYDTDGDEFYNATHLYCRFADQGAPYETLKYRLLVRDGYSPELPKAKMIRRARDE